MGLFITLVLPFTQDLIGVKQDSCGTNNMIGRNRNLKLVVTKGQGKLATAGKLLILPSFDFVVNCHPGKELGNGIEVIIILRKIFHTRSASSIFHSIVYIIPPLDFQVCLLPGLQGLG